MERQNSIDLSGMTFDSPLVNRTRPTSEIFLNTPHKNSIDYGLGPSSSSIGGLGSNTGFLPPQTGSAANSNAHFRQSFSHPHQFSHQSSNSVHHQHQHHHSFHQHNPSTHSLFGGTGSSFVPPFATATGGNDQIDQAAEQWLADLQLYQQTLEQMATVSLDKNFKDELSAIEQWFQMLSVGEQTAALYSLLQQTTPIQIRFFMTVLQQFANKDPLSSALSPTTSEFAHAPASPRQSEPTIPTSELPSTLLKQYNQQQHHHQQQPPAVPAPSKSPFMSPPSKEYAYNSFLGNNNASGNSSAGTNNQSKSPWSGSEIINRPRSAAPPENQLHPGGSSSQVGGGHQRYRSVHLTESNPSWASMMNTPTSTTFSGATSNSASKVNAEIANATAMKLAALGTVNGRIMLDDVKKYRRRGSYISDEDQKILEREFANMQLQDAAAAAAAQTTERPMTPSSKQGLPKKDVNYTEPELLEDIGGWLRTLRLHKYTDNLKDLDWKEMVQLSDEDLQKRGVTALGARRKMLKVFEQVRETHQF
ncbi:hypothetical protein TRVA0_046S00672 [Trichomonascus vanleenenianus]|uniref:Vts1p n=1 Tax=Trichomonascus vanleenenianus TaxID=2268995 RepID=UPI003ECA8E6C